MSPSANGITVNDAPLRLGTSLHIYLETGEALDFWPMKIISCLELGGACSQAFRGSSFEEVASQSQQHGAEMAAMADQPHLDAMSEMMTILESGHVQEWMDAKMEFFALLPDDGQ